MNLKHTCLSGLLALATCFAFAECASAQGPWRTRYVRRDGLFHVEKYTTGNGLTPAAAGVFTTLINNAPEIINAATGKDGPEQSAEREPLPEHYIEQQRRANDLLERTARLVNHSISADTPDNRPEPAAEAGRPASPEFGNRSPWKPRPNTEATSPGAAAPENIAPAAGTPATGKSPWKPRPE